MSSQRNYTQGKGRGATRDSLRKFIAVAGLVLGLTSCGKEEPQGILFIRSEPPGAEVYCDGDLVIGATTPAKLRLAPGPHLISLRKPKHEELRQTVHVLENRVVDLKVAMRESKGVALLETDPPNVEVRIKSTGVKLGTTPLLLTELPMDETVLTLIRDGYDPADILVSISDRVPYIVKETLNSRLAPIFINSIPEGATVYLNGELLEKTPVKREYLAGTYKVRIQMEGRNIVTDTIEIVPRQEFSKTYELIESPVVLEITSNPEGATVYVNGKLQGKTPLQLKDQPAGAYDIRFTLPKHLDVKKQITLQPGKEGTVDAKLETNVGVIQVQTRPPGVEVRVDGQPVGVTKSTKNQETSDVLMIPEIEAGERKVELIKEKFHVVTQTVTVNREQIVLVNPAVIAMQQKDDTKLWLKGSTTPRLGVILNRLPDGSIEFSSSGGSIKNTYGPEEIERIEEIKD